MKTNSGKKQIVSFNSFMKYKNSYGFNKYYAVIFNYKRMWHFVMMNNYLWTPEIR